VIRLDDIELLISLALYSAYVKGEKPISLFLVSKVESGKSQLLSKYSEVPRTAYLSDCTAWGIARHYGADLALGKIRHLLFPEFTIPISRKAETVRALDAFLCGLIEEGIAEIVSFQWKPRVRAPYGSGVIVCLSQQEFKDKEKLWFRIGLMSRLVPVSYDYTEATKKEIFKYIKKRRYHREVKVKLDFPGSSSEILLPQRYADEMEVWAKEQVTGTELYGFRWQRHFQRLAMANALRCHRKLVTKEDVDLIDRLRKYMNTECRERI